MGLNVKYKLLQNLWAADIGHKYILEQGSTKIGLYIYGLEISNSNSWVARSNNENARRMCFERYPLSNWRKSEVDYILYEILTTGDVRDHRGLFRCTIPWQISVQCATICALAKLQIQFINCCLLCNNLPSITRDQVLMIAFEKCSGKGSHRVPTLIYFCSCFEGEKGPQYRTLNSGLIWFGLVSSRWPIDWSYLISLLLVT